jgi:methionine sulfoxide reductase heme-binding subunit
MTLPPAAAGPSVYWYLTRATGAVALLLLTAAVVLGVVDVRRWSSARWPRFVIDAIHRNVSLLAMVFLVLHILTSVLDGFASISPVDAVVPFAGSYRPFWLGLGAVAFDLLLAVMITSLLRQRIGYSGWRAVHWLTYASWPIALLHGLGTGSDVQQAWLLWLDLACLALVLGAVIVRVLAGWPANARARAAALGAVAAFALFLAIWIPSGPLGSEWARRSGTPAALLGHSRAETQASAQSEARAQTQASAQTQTPASAQTQSTVAERAR